MSRGLDTATEAAINQQKLAPIIFAELNFSSGMVRLHSALGVITWGGYDWTGVGTLGKIGQIEEVADLSRKTVSFDLSGIPPEVISIVYGEQYQGRSAKVYVGFFDMATYQLVSTPFLMYRGKMDIAEDEEGESCSVTITAESRTSSWNRAQVRRLTDADQRTRHPTDRGFEFIDQAASKEIIWGRKA